MPAAGGVNVGGEFTGLGLLTVPAALFLGVLALWGGLRILGGLGGQREDHCRVGAVRPGHNAHLIGQLTYHPQAVRVPDRPLRRHVHVGLCLQGSGNLRNPDQQHASLTNRRARIVRFAAFTVIPVQAGSVHERGIFCLALDHGLVPVGAGHLPVIAGSPAVGLRGITVAVGGYPVLASGVAVKPGCFPGGPGLRQHLPHGRTVLAVADPVHHVLFLA